MADMAGKTAAVLEWAKGWPELDGYLKLNALIAEDGEATMATSYTDSPLETYNDGTAKRRYSFFLKVVTAWSDGYDPVNEDAEKLASSWLDWVNDQYPANVPDWPGASIVGIESAQGQPSLSAVYQDDGLAEYAIQAVITYIE